VILITVVQLVPITAVLRPDSPKKRTCCDRMQGLALTTGCDVGAQIVDGPAHSKPLQPCDGAVGLMRLCGDEYVPRSALPYLSLF
jgi:hypothetical protein